MFTSTKFKKVSFLMVSFLILFVFAATIVLAQASGSTGNSPPGSAGNSPGAVELDNPFGSNNKSLFGLLRAVINDIILPMGGVLAVLSFIYSGFLYVVAQGNESKLAIAHRALLYTSIGTAVLLGSWVLANVICKTIGQLGGPICPP